MFNISVNLRDAKKVDHILKRMLYLNFFWCTLFHLSIFRNQRRYISHLSILTLSIYKFGLSVCLFVCLSVCLFVSNKRQNGWTDRAQIFCGTSHDPREGLWMIKFLKICLHQNSIFENPRNFLFLLFVNKEKPCVLYFEKWNKRWARSALKA